MPPADAPSFVRRWGWLVGVLSLFGVVGTWLAAREYAPQLADAQVKEDCLEAVGKAKQEMEGEVKAAGKANDDAHRAIRVEVAQAKEGVVRLDERVQAVQGSIQEMRTAQREERRDTRQALEKLLRRRSR